MKFKNSTPLRVRYLLYIVVIGIGIVTQAQPPSHVMKFSPVIDNNVNGFWEYLPRNYASETNQKYPLLIFFHGYGDSGSTPDSATLSKVLNAGTPRIITTGEFPESFNFGGKSYKFIVLSPQIKNGLDDATRSSNVSPSTVDAIIEYAKSAYRVDASRIYLCGLSMGGGIAWDYSASSVSAAKKVAAIAVAAAATDINTQEADNIAIANLPILATHNIVDLLILYTRTVANIYNVKESKKKLKETLRQANVQDTADVEPLDYYWATAGVGELGLDPHNAWSRTFEDLQPGTTAGGNIEDSIGITVYDWLLTHNRAEESTLPVSWESFSIQESDNVVLINWSTSMELNVSRFVVEKSKDGINWIELGTLFPKQEAGTSKAYSFTDNDPYQEKSFYRIKQIDKDGTASYSAMKMLNRNNLLVTRIYPNPFVNQVSVDISKAVETSNIYIRLTNANGAVIRTIKNKISPASGNSITIQGLQQLSKGVYYLIMEDEGGGILLKTKLLKH